MTTDLGSALPAEDQDAYTEQGGAYWLTPDLLRALPAQGSGYTQADRINAVVAWAVSGNAEAASALCGIDGRTIRHWTGEPWWTVLLAEIARRKRMEMDGRMQGLLERALDQVQDRLEHGDVTIHQGVTVRHPVRARDATVIAGIMYDKLALLRGQATSRVERVNLGELRGQMRQIIEGDAQAISNSDDANTDKPNQSNR